MSNRHFPEREIPFYGNPDGMSCGQCVYKMMLEYFFPEVIWDFKRINEMCDAEKGKYTWVYSIILNLVQMDLQVLNHSNFNTPEFLEDPEKYLIEFCGEEGCKDNFENSNMDKVLDKAKEYVDYSNHSNLTSIQGFYTIDTIKKYLLEGYLIGAWINSSLLNKGEGFSGHFVLIHDFDDNNLIIHDPGGLDDEGKASFQIKNRKIAVQDFIRFSSPKIPGETAGLVAIRKKS